jgi:ubiquinone/menaquinone biosynthesis C-methylase UbiE
MVKIESFEKYSKEYDEWFTKNRDIYQAELNAIKTLIPSEGVGIEIGVGTGRFAIPLGVKIGVEPSRKMAQISRARGIKVYEAVAEKLPFNDKTFDFVLMITTICFLDDPIKSLKECYRVLKNDGFIIIGFVDNKSKLGKKYQSRKKNSKFYGYATFYSVKEILNLLYQINFKSILIKQTVFDPQTEKMNAVKNGYGQGSFVVIKAIKSLSLVEDNKC